MGIRRKIDITKQDIRCCGEISMDENGIGVEYELWFDVDRYFGTDTDACEDTWINFYTFWKVDGLHAKYYVESDTKSEEHVWRLTSEEEKFFLNKMEEYVQETEEMSLLEMWISTCLEEWSDETCFSFNSVKKEGDFIELSMQGDNPCGEDWCEELTISEPETKGELLNALTEELWRLYNNFDVDENVAMMLEAKRNGFRGVPDAVDLVHNEEFKENALENFAIKLSGIEGNMSATEIQKCLNKWTEESRISFSVGYPDFGLVAIYVNDPDKGGWDEVVMIPIPESENDLAWFLEEWVLRFIYDPDLRNEDKGEAEKQGVSEEEFMHTRDYEVVVLKKFIEKMKEIRDGE